MSIRISCADFAWRYLSHQAIVDVITTIGFEGIDVSLFRDYSVLSLDYAIAEPDRFARELTERLTGAELELVDLFPGDLERFAVNTPDESERIESRELFKGMIEVARRLTPAPMSLSPGMKFSGDATAAALARCIEELKWRLDYAAERGVTMSIEPHQGSILDNLELVGEFVDRLPDVRLTLDYGHFIYDGVPQREIDAFLPYARHLHARGGRKGLVQARLEENEIDWSQLVTAARTAGFSGWIAVEYIHDPRPGGTDCDTLHDIVTLKRELEEVISAQDSTAGRRASA